MSALVHGVVAGPTLKKLTPASTASCSASAPDGVVPPRGGPFASTIGKTFAPFKSTVPFESRLVGLAPAAETTTSMASTTETATAACLIALPTPPNPRPREQRRRISVERIGGPERLLVDAAHGCRSVRCQ